MLWRILRTDAIGIFENYEILKCIPRYVSIVKGKEEAYHLKAKKVKVEIPLSSPLNKLWKEHDRLLSVLKRGADEDELASPNLLDLKAEIAMRLLESCIFCERRCKVNRVKGEKGFCRLDSRARVASYFSHIGEEPPLIPSGTIFFSSCNFRCVYCQNWDISTNPESGYPVDEVRLARIMDKLVANGCININLVGGDPTPNLHVILKALRHFEKNVPIIWNSNLYNSVESMKLLDGVIDLWLPDFKYWNDKCAESLSSVPNYREIATRNHLIAYRSGEVLIRHLVIPGHIECCTKPILKWIAENMPKALVNIMGQYRPEHQAYKIDQINRRPTHTEMRQAYTLADRLGLNYKSVS